MIVIVDKTNKKKCKSSKDFSTPAALKKGEITIYCSKYCVNATIKRLGNLMSLKKGKPNCFRLNGYPVEILKHPQTICHAIS